MIYLLILLVNASSKEVLIEVFRGGFDTPLLLSETNKDILGFEWPNQEQDTITSVGVRQNYLAGTQIADKYLPIKSITDIEYFVDNTRTHLKAAQAHFYGIFAEGKEIEEHKISASIPEVADKAKARQISDELDLKLNSFDLLFPVLKPLQSSISHPEKHCFFLQGNPQTTIYYKRNLNQHINAFESRIYPLIKHKLNSEFNLSLEELLLNIADTLNANVGRGKEIDLEPEILDFFVEYLAFTRIDLFFEISLDQVKLKLTKLLRLIQRQLESGSKKFTGIVLEINTFSSLMRALNEGFGTRIDNIQYGSSLLIEYKEVQGSEISVLFNHNPVVQCSKERFINFIQKFVVSDENIALMCRKNSEMKVPKWAEAYYIGFSVVSTVITGFLVYLKYFSRDKIKKVEENN